MSQQGSHKKPKDWNHLLEPAPKVKGPSKPWDAQSQASADEFIAFLKDPENKDHLKNFIIETYKKLETDRIERAKAQYENETRVDNASGHPFHKPSNITPLASDDLSMADTEKTFARGLRATKKSLERSVEEHVEEINRLLAGIGGFNSQIKSCFARSTVVFLEQDDPKHSYRERLIFSIHLPNYELKRSWDLKEGPERDADDPRSAVQATWDDAINALAKIIETAGLKPKYCKNDRNYGRFVMKQDLRSSNKLPDEYFSLTLDYNTGEKITEMTHSYNRIVNKYNKKIESLRKKLARYPSSSVSARYERLKKQHLDMVQERDFFVGTVPDPNQLDEGLLFLIEVSTLKDYYTVKNRMQSIMTKFILHLSQIAAKEAAVDPDLEYELWKTGQIHPSGEFDSGLSRQELDELPEYTVEGGELRALPKKKAA